MTHTIGVYIDEEMNTIKISGWKYLQKDIQIKTIKALKDDAKITESI